MQQASNKEISEIYIQAFITSNYPIIVIKAALRYGGWLLIGGLMAQGFSYLGRLIMISTMDSLNYGRFVLLWNFYLFILIFGHFNLHSPIVYRIQGNLDTLYSNKTLAYAALQLTFITGTISSIAIVLYSMYLQYSVFIGLLLGFSLLMYSIFITLDGLSRSVDQPNYGSLSYALIGLIRIFLIVLIVLGIIYYSSDYFVLAYIIPIYIMPLPIFILFRRKSGMSMKNAFTKVYYKEIKWLIFSSVYVVISDLSKNGYLFFLVSFIAYTINIEALKVFDFIFTIISLSSLVTDENDQIINYIEKPKYEFDVSMGIYAMNKSIISLIPENTFFDLPDLIMKLKETNKIMKIYKHQGQWLDVGRHDDYSKAIGLFETEKRNEFLR